MSLVWTKVAVPCRGHDVFNMLDIFQNAEVRDPAAAAIALGSQRALRCGHGAYVQRHELVHGLL